MAHVCIFSSDSTRKRPMPTFSLNTKGGLQASQTPFAGTETVAPPPAAATRGGWWWCRCVAPSESQKELMSELRRLSKSLLQSVLPRRANYASCLISINSLLARLTNLGPLRVIDFLQNHAQTFANRNSMLGGGGHVRRHGRRRQLFLPQGEWQARLPCERCATGH